MLLDFVLTDCFAGTMGEFMAETETNTADCDLVNLFEDFDIATDESTTDTDSTTYAAWIADMDAKLKAAIAEDELDANDDFYASYKGVVKPRVYFNGVKVDAENMPTYDEVIDNCKPIDPIFE